jgi:NDP-sugar pyrophosphorylase family protein
LAHTLHQLGAPFIARLISAIAHAETGVDIHPAAEIGSAFFIDHGTGVVIGETTVIGSNVRLYQAVTLGAKHFPVDEDGILIKGNARHPIIEDDVVIYAGATVLGRIVVGAAQRSAAERRRDQDCPLGMFAHEGSRLCPSSLALAPETMRLRLGSGRAAANQEECKAYEGSPPAYDGVRS